MKALKFDIRPKTRFELAAERRGLIPNECSRTRAVTKKDHKYNRKKLHRVENDW